MPNPRGLDDAEQIKFNIGETPREWMYRHDIAIADRCEGHEAEIDEVPGNGRIILKRRETIECPRLVQRDQTKQRHKDKPDTEVKQDGADDSMERDRPRREYSACDHSAERDAQDHPGRGIEVNVNV